MPLSPFEMAFSIAVIWLAVSPSSLPAAVVRVMPSFLADSSAPLAMATKKGFVEVLVIKVTPIAPPGEPAAAPEPAGEEPPPLELQATNTTAAVATTARPRIPLPRVEWFT